MCEDCENCNDEVKNIFAENIQKTVMYHVNQLLINIYRYKKMFRYNLEIKTLIIRKDQ